jgi:myo-inositol-1(or 4)-monophosphatase|tara:strand:+ start:5552 stop:6325 length:774 start_codon:yes stop_codon:yes gene_type:complete
LKVSLAEDQRHYLSIAEKAAKASGYYLRKEINSNTRVIQQLDRDVKLEADYHSETLLIEALAKETDFPILTEEQGLINKSNSVVFSEYEWIVDPLDGSLNFSRHIPMCCVSVGLWKDKIPLLGVIYDFIRNEIFSGLVSEGAWLNGKPVKTTNTKIKSKAVLATGFPVSTDFSKDALMDFVEDVVEYKKIRLFGSAALSLAYVACGRVDAYKENDIKIWDVAAGLALVKAAGGDISYKNSYGTYGFDVRGASSISLL